eukprot:762075-Karenia_brevis.AAC.1
MWQVGFLGVRVGEAKHPGPLRVVSANVTSLLTQCSVIDELVADIVGLQETRLSELGQVEIGRSLLDKGWQCFWGKPQPPQLRVDINFEPSPWNASHG